MGIDQRGQPNWATGGRFTDVIRAIDEVQEICGKAAQRTCKIIVANRDFRVKEFFELVEQFKEFELTKVRQAFLKSLTNPPAVTSVFNGLRSTTSGYQNSPIYSSQN